MAHRFTAGISGLNNRSDRFSTTFTPPRATVTIVTINQNGRSHVQVLSTGDFLKGDILRISNDFDVLQ